MTGLGVPETPIPCPTARATYSDFFQFCGTNRISEPGAPLRYQSMALGARDRFYFYRLLSGIYLNPTGSPKGVWRTGDISTVVYEYCGEHFPEPRSANLT